jgi:lysyl-tRNA synthetase class 2
MASRLQHAAVLAGVVLAGVLVPLAALGWLYLVRGHVTLCGPTLHDALPLDELAGHDGVPLFLFLIVWSAVAVSLGLVARAARIERLTAGILYAAVTGVTLYLTAGFSIFIVRQISMNEAFEVAGGLGEVYLGAAYAGVGGALLGVHRKGGRPWSALLAAFMAVAGLLNVVSALAPRSTPGMNLIEGTVPDLTRALIAPLGLVAMLLALGLRRQRRRAWELTLLLVLVAAALQLLRAVDYREAAVNLLVAVVLLARRNDFTGPGDPVARRRLPVQALLWLVGIFAYGFVAIWINRIAIDRPFSPRFALRETALSLVGLGFVRHHVYGHWFALSVFLLGLIAAFNLLWEWLAPWRYQLAQTQRQRDRARALVRSFGVDSLSPFVLRADNSYFFSEDEQAMLAYTVVAAVAVVSGDPIGPENAVRSLLRRFLDFVHERDWRIGVLGASQRYLSLYYELGLHAIYHGDEAVIDVDVFSLEGRAIRKVRQSVTRLGRKGYRAEVLYAGDVDEGLRGQLERIFKQWCGKATVKGHAMELDTLFRLDGDDALFVIGRDQEGLPRGFLHFVCVPAVRTLSLSSMPRERDTPNGFTEWLVVATIDWAREHGFEHVSLNFVPLARIFDGAARGLRRSFQLMALARLKRHGFQLDNLLQFCRKFSPRWEHRYVVYERAGDLLWVSVAGLAAEGYLPLTVVKR